MKKSRKPCQPPTPVPEALYFETESGSVDHLTVMSEMKKLMKMFRGTRVESVQYVPHNKWKVVMDSVESRNRLSGSTIVLNGAGVCLRRYDDVANLEFKKYLRAHGYISMLDQT